MTGDMDVARLTVLKGLSISQTHGFCHFCPVKSEATPTQLKSKLLLEYEDVIKNQTDIPIT
jgi:hypothetical protein